MTRQIIFQPSNVKVGGGGGIAKFCSLLLLGLVGVKEFLQTSKAADSTLADGESRTFTAFNLTDNFSAPMGEGTSATLILQNSSEMKFFTGNITGNINLHHTGGNLRLYNEYNDVTPFNGNIYLQSTSHFYLRTGKELGSGTIYLQNTGHLVNDGSNFEGVRIQNGAIDNNIILSNTSTTENSNRMIRGRWNSQNSGPCIMTLNGVISDDPEKGGLT